MGDLILSQANESHEGSYLCQAKNGIGSSGKSKLITIKVDGKDIILIRIHIKPIYWIKRSRILTHSAPKYFLKKCNFLCEEET